MHIFFSTVNSLSYSISTYWENSCSFGLRYVSWYKYLIVSLVFSHLGFWSGNLFLIAPFPDLCLLVPFYDFCDTLISEYIMRSGEIPKEWSLACFVRSEKLMKPHNYVEGHKFCRLTDLTICRSTDTCCFKSCFHEQNMQINKTALRYMLKSFIFNGTYH